jgi:hypothetical protein
MPSPKFCTRPSFLEKGDRLQSHQKRSERFDTLKIGENQSGTWSQLQPKQLLLKPPRDRACTFQKVLAPMEYERNTILRATLSNQRHNDGQGAMPNKRVV